ncbi:MAG: hypothetical protein WB507_02730 [Solirubrobacterales bacterium]
MPAKRQLALVWALASLLSLSLASTAGAADTVYWANYEGGAISFANLAGGGGGNLDTTGASAKEANGLAIYSATGKIYWITAPGGKIFYANLSGGGGGELSTTGATVNFPVGLAIDPAAGRLYWANGGANKISYANLNGSGGGDLDTTGATVEDPLGVAVDPATARIYWANAAGKISYANISGGGGGDLNTTGATVEVPAGVAIDPSSGRIYWANEGADKISYANLNGSGGGDLNTTGATVETPFGVAIDPSAGRIYWADETANKISYANLDGSGGADLNTAGAMVDHPAFPILLKAPGPAAAPLASGGPMPGSTLTCTPASWSGDLLESFLYRAPQSTSLQWLKEGQPISGANTNTLSAATVGSYSCQGIATDQAGSTTQTSAPVAIFSLGKVKANRRKGTASLAVQVAGPGALTLTGKQLVKQQRTSSASSIGTVKLLVKPKGKASRALRKKGKVRVAVIVTFMPQSGSGGSEAKTLVLRKTPRSNR